HTLYVIDGLYDNDSDARKVWTGDFDVKTGHLPALTTMGALPDGVIAISSEATVHDHTLLVMDSKVPDPETSSPGSTFTLRTPVPTMSWSTDDSGIGFRSQTQYAFTDGFVYALGGYEDPAVGATTKTFVAPITGGVVAKPVASTPLPTPTGWGEAAAVDGWLF